jgi:hypothetical protein
MRKLCRVDLERSEELFRKLDEYIKKVVKKLSPEKIIMFGSFARKDFNEGSDIDLIVICNWKEDFLDRIGVLLELNDLGLPLEPLGYTEVEVEMMVNNGNPFITEVLKEGRVMYDRGQP